MSKDYSERYRKFSDRWYNELNSLEWRSKEWYAALAKHLKELDAQMKDDDFALGAMAYELENHEYIVSQDPWDAMEALGLTREEVEGSKRLSGLLERAIDISVGIDGVPDNEETSYYKLVRRTDYTYTAKNAIIEWLDEHPDVREELTDEWASENGDERWEYYPLDDLEDFLSGMNVWDVFSLGLHSQIVWSDPYFRFDGNGNIESISEIDVEKIRREITREDQFAEDILNGELAIPADMAQIVRMFAWDGDKIRTANLKPGKSARRKPAAGARKAPARAKRAGTVRSTSAAGKRATGRPIAKAKAPARKPAAKKPIAGARKAPARAKRAGTVRSTSAAGKRATGRPIAKAKAPARRLPAKPTARRARKRALNAENDSGLW